MLSLGQTLANAAGLRPRKKFHFEVVFKLEELLNCTYVSGVLFAKIRLKEGGHFSYSSKRLVIADSYRCFYFSLCFSSVEVNKHKVSWDDEVRFPCKLYASANTAELEPCICKVSVRKVKLEFKAYSNSPTLHCLFYLCTQPFLGNSWWAVLQEGEEWTTCGVPYLVCLMMYIYIIYTWSSWGMFLSICLNLPGLVLCKGSICWKVIMNTNISQTIPFYEWKWCCDRYLEMYSLKRMFPPSCWWSVSMCHCRPRPPVWEISEHVVYLSHCFPEP